MAIPGSFSYRVWNNSEIHPSNCVIFGGSGGSTISNQKYDGDYTWRSINTYTDNFYYRGNDGLYASDIEATRKGTYFDITFKENPSAVKVYAVLDINNAPKSTIYDVTSYAKMFNISGSSWRFAGSACDWAGMESAFPDMFTKWNDIHASKDVDNYQTGVGYAFIVTTGANVKKYTVTETLTHMNSDAPTEVNENAEFTFTYTVEPGYEIQTLTSNIGTVAIADSKKSATIKGTATGNIVINGVAVEEVTEYTVTENLTHITASDSNPKTVNKNASFVLNYTAETGYIITSLTTTVGSITYNVDNSSATITGVATADIVVTGTATYQPKTYNVVVEKDAHIVADPANPETITEGSSYTLRFTSESGYLIARCTSNYGTVSVAEDKKSATITYNNVSATWRVVLTSVEEIIPKLLITGTFENATCNYTNGEVISKEKNVVITATSGYEFKNTYHYEDNGYSYDLVKNLEKTTLTIDTTKITGLSDITLNDNYVATLPVETIGGFCNLYKVTEKELSQVSKVRFQKNATSDTVVDYGSSITQLYILPLNIPAEIIGDKSHIILGAFDSQVESTLLNNYTVDYDMGSIPVPAKYNNAYDFINTTCTLRVPFFNAVALDPENVVGHTISIKFTLDLYSGNVTMNVVSDFTGGIIYSATANIVTQIPFIQKQNNSVVNQLSNVFKYTIATPVIEVVRNIPYQADNSTFGRETIQVAKLSTVSGYCEIDNVNLVTLATNDEKEQIVSLLKEGVFINE